MSVAPERLQPEEPTFSVAEAAYIAGLEEKVVEREIDAGILVTGGGGPSVRERLLGAGAILYLAAISLHRTDMNRALRIALARAIEREDTAGKSSASLGFLTIDLDGVRASIAERLAAVREMHAAVVSDPRIGSGEPILRGSRHRVHQVAELDRLGASEAEFREEYALTPDQVRIARLYDRLHPRRGRPLRPAVPLRAVTEHVPDHRRG